MRHSRGLKRCQSEVWGWGSGAGRQVDWEGAPTHRPSTPRPGGGGADGVGSGARRDSLPSEPPASPPRRSSNFTKSEISRRPRGRRHPDGAGPAPGGLVRANFERPVGTLGRVAGAASGALCLSRRLRFVFDVCESSGRLRRQAADSCVL